MLRRLLPDPFIVALILAVLLASLLPARGGFGGVVDALATASIMLLFFFHGAKLPRDQVLAGLTHWRLHLVILAATFALFPLLVFVLSIAVPGALPPLLWTGMLFLGALPATVQSAIAFTSIARGNVPAAIASSSASQMLGIALTPLLVSLLAGARGAAVEMTGVGLIVVEIFVPFLAGHLLRPWIGAWVTRHKPLIGFTDRGTVILAVYSAFSAAVIEGLWHRLPVATLGVVTLLCAILLAAALALTWAAGRAGGFGRADRITILFCGTKKSLIQGVPMARVLFAGPDVGVILLPIMIFHQMQLMVCAWIAARFARDDVGKG